MLNIYASKVTGKKNISIHSLTLRHVLLNQETANVGHYKLNILFVNSTCYTLLALKVITQGDNVPITIFVLVYIYFASR